MKNEKTTEHESFGMVGISNISCSGGLPLFGSPIKHNRIIALRIKTANVTRNLHKEWYFGKNDIIEIYLSSSQFTDLITNPNIGFGTPCTITYTNGKKMEEPPYQGQNEIFAEELQLDFQKAMDDSKTLVQYAEEMLTKKGTLKATEKKELLSKIRMLSQHIEKNIPFLHKQFTKAMDKTVAVAKAEIQGFYASTIMKLGRRALKKLNKPDVPRIEND